MQTSFEIEAPDGYRLAANLFAPKEAADAVLVINGGVAVSQRFYFSLARYLADNRIAVVAYDYRGLGASRPPQLRGFQGGFKEWALDGGAALTWARDRFPDLPLALLGHSFGGILPALTPESRYIDAGVTVSAHLSYYKDWADGDRWKIYLQWHVLLPLVTRVWGYFPGKRFKISDDLPASFVHDWHTRRKHEDWRTQLPDLGVTSYADQVTCPVVAIAPTDDPICTERALDRAHRELVNVKSFEKVLIDPAEAGLEKIGHFGYFRPENGRRLWPDLVERIRVRIDR